MLTCVGAFPVFLHGLVHCDDFGSGLEVDAPEGHRGSDPLDFRWLKPNDSEIAAHLIQTVKNPAGVRVEGFASAV